MTKVTRIQIEHFKDKLEEIIYKKETEITKELRQELYQWLLKNQLKFKTPLNDYCSLGSIEGYLDHKQFDEFKQTLEDKIDSIIKPFYELKRTFIDRFIMEGEDYKELIKEFKKTIGVN